MSPHRFFRAVAVIVCAARLSAPLWGQWTGGPTGPISYVGGNVGIGTPNPTIKLHVWQSSDNNVNGIAVTNVTNSRSGFLWMDASDLFHIDNATNGSRAIILNGSGAGGNVGIGTASPGAQLHVFGSDQGISNWGNHSQAVLRLNNNYGAAGVGGEVQFSQYGFPPYAAITSVYQNGSGNSLGSLAISTRQNLTDANLTPRLWVNYDGNLGIGTPTPGTARANIVGPTSDSSSYGLLVQNSGGLPLIAARGDGNVGIGTTNPQHLLHVAGVIGAQEVIVSSTGADYVFEPGYRLKPLAEVAGYIQEHHHLPDIPSADDVQEKGVSVGEMQTKLLAKIEELTLHMIQEHERNDRLEQQNRELQQRIGEIRAQLGANASAAAGKEAR